MSDFSTVMELEIALDETSVKNARRQLESDLGPMPDGGTDSSAMSAQAARGGGRARRRQRRKYRWARERTEYAEQSVGYLEEIEDKVGEDGGGGIMGTLIDEVSDTGGDAVGAGALTAAAGALTTSAAAHTKAAGALTAAAGALAGSDIVDLLLGDKSISVEEPEWIPLAVEEPEPLPIEDPPGQIPIEDPPGPIGFKPLPGPVGFKGLPGPVGFEDLPGPVEFEDLPGPVGFGDLPGPVGFEDLPGPVGLEQPGEPYPVEDVDPIEVAVDINASAGEGGEGGRRERPPAREPQSSSSDEDSGGLPRAFHEDLPFTNIREEILGNSVEAITGEDNNDGSQNQSYSPSASDPQRRGQMERSNRQQAYAHRTQQDSDSGGTISVSATQSGEASPVIQVTNNSRHDVTIDPDVRELAKAAVDAMEDSFQDDIDEIRNDLEELESRWDKFERDVQRRG